MMTTHLSVALAALSLSMSPALADPPGKDGWIPVAGFARGEDTGRLGNTHGGVAIDSEGLVYSNTDTERSIVVHRPDGSFVRAIAGEYPGIHGMVIRKEGDEEFIYAAHLAGKGRFLVYSNIDIALQPSGLHHLFTARPQPRAECAREDVSNAQPDRGSKLHIHIHPKRDHKQIRSPTGFGGSRAPWWRGHPRV